MTSYFEIQGCPNRKQKKKTFTWQWRNSKGKARQMTDRSQPNEVTGSSLRELKTGRLVLTDKF